MDFNDSPSNVDSSDSSLGPVPLIIVYSIIKLDVNLVGLH